jgi:diguanylate cyclase (GGDEF)-like protein/PAS domain S-box-containing protein
LTEASACRWTGVGQDGDRAEATLAWLRDTHPGAVVSALAADGQPVPVPVDLGFAPAPPPDPGVPTGLEAIHPDDRLAVLRAYERGRNRGVSAVAVRVLSGDPVQIHFVDLRPTHGIVVSAAVPDDGSNPLRAEEDAEDFAPMVTWVRLDRSGVYLEHGEAGLDMFGWPVEEMAGKESLPFIHPDDRDRAIDNWLQVLVAPGEKRRYRVRHLRRDGSYLWLDVTNQNRLEDPAHGDVLSEMVDISDEMAAHEALQEREQHLRELADALPVGVVRFDSDRVVEHENEQLKVIVGAAGLDGLLAAVGAEDRVALDAAIDAVLDGQVPEPLEVRLAGDRVCRVTFRPLSGSGGLACVDDVTEAARLRRELEVRATFDSLTACYTRSAILGALDHVLAEPPGTGVVFVDLDRFKPVNDELGHAAGDELLAIVGERLRHAVREVDLVGRLGGDEFLIVCPGVAGAADVEAIATRVATHLASPMALFDEHLVRPRASIGVAWAAAGADAAALVARADAAMYESKRAAAMGTTIDLAQPRVAPNSPTKLTISPG